MNLKVNINKRDDGSIVVCPEGSIDTDTYNFLQKQLTPVIKDARGGVILDMAKVDYVSSIGFAVIIRTKQALEKRGIALAITNLQPNVQKVFDAIKTIPESVFATLKDADDYLDKYIAYIHGKKSEDKRKSSGDPT